MAPTQEQKDWAMGIMHKLFDLGFYDAISYHRDQDSTTYYHLGLYDWERTKKEDIVRLPIKFYSGETKVCIVSKECPDWVVKIGFERTTLPEYVKSHTDQNFCELEADYYTKACDNNIAYCFAATYKIGEIDGIPIFMQEYADTNEDMFEDIFANYMESIYSKDDDEDEEEYSSRIEEYVEDMENSDRIYAVLGEDSDDIVEFIEEHDINDLHSSNWGVTPDGRFVMIDYSGYCG